MLLILPESVSSHMESGKVELKTEQGPALATHVLRSVLDSKQVFFSLLGEIPGGCFFVWDGRMFSCSNLVLT